jgi:hypothetical protein
MTGDHTGAARGRRRSEPANGTPDRTRSRHGGDAAASDPADRRAPHNDSVTVALAITVSADAGAHGSYSRCSSIREHRHVLLRTESRGPRSCLAGGGRPATEDADRPPRRGPLGSASSDNGRAARRQRSAVRPEDAELGGRARRLLNPDGGNDRQQVPAGMGCWVRTAADGAAVRTPSDRCGEASRHRADHPAAGAVAGGCACRQDQGSRRSARCSGRPRP